MPNPMIRIHNVETDEIIDREMTSAEIADYEQSLLPTPLTELEIAKEQKKAALLDKLGITHEEAKLLLS
jgi:hypothetical protein